MTIPRASRALAALLLFQAFGCDSAPSSEAPVFVDGAFSNRTYHFVGLDKNDEVVLLGDISFSERSQEALSGSWSLKPWGTPEALTNVPESGTLTGTVHGTDVIVRLGFPDNDRSLGLLVEGFRGERMVGSLTALPGSEFKGRFEAIEFGMGAPQSP